MSTIAFIGLGNMGGPMAANLVKAGHRVLGFDLVAELREAAPRRGRARPVRESAPAETLVQVQTAPDNGA